MKSSKTVVGMAGAILLCLTAASHAQTVTSQITGTFPNYTWAEWDQTASSQMNINADPAQSPCWSGLLLNEWPAYPSTGAWSATWNMNVPIAGRYMMEMEYAMDAGSPRPGNIYVNGALNVSNAIGDATGGWCSTNLVWSNLGVVTLNAGVNAIRWDRVGGTVTPHFHGIRLTKMDAPLLGKTFAPNSALVGAGGGTVTSTLTINLQNPGNATGYTGPLTTTADFTDSLPAGVQIAPAPNAATTCQNGGAPATLTATAGAPSVTLPSGATIPAGGCTITVDVSVPTNAAAVFTNIIPAGALQTNAGNTAVAAQAVFSVAAAAAVPTIGQWGWLLLSLMAAGMAVLGLRRVGASR